MAGILNNKERIMDSLITQLGREQAAQGVLKFRFASFTDYHTFYQASGSNNVAEDHTSRLYFEAHSRPQDLIIPELQLGNQSRPFRTKDFELQGTYLASGSFNTGVELYPNVITGSNIEEASNKFLKGLLGNLSDNQMIATKDTFNEEVGFSLAGRSTGSFIYKDTRFKERRDDNNIRLRTPFNDGAPVVLVSDAPSLFADSRVNHLPNFTYLPPVNKPSVIFPRGTVLGNYPRLDNAQKTIQQISTELEENSRQYETFAFENTSRDNNILIQAFEISTSGANIGNFTKLDMIDYGEFYHEQDTERPEKRVFFIGKVINENDFESLAIKDDYMRKIHDDEQKVLISQMSSNSQSFFNIFTVVLD